MRKILLLSLLVTACSLWGRQLPFHCEQDTVKINRILSSLKDKQSAGDRMVLVAKAFIDSPQDDYYTTDSIGELRINIDSFTPMMFLNSAVALTQASFVPGNIDWRTFATAFENTACRRGEDKGFPSIMFHFSDWISDHLSRGNVVELTEYYSPVIARTKSLDEMTRNRSRYAALSDSATFETVRMTEMGFRSHRVPTLKKETIKRKDLADDLQNGDIIVLVPNHDGTDYYDIGIISIEEGMPYLIHLSPQAHKVVMEKDGLARYMNLVTKHFQGYRIVRLKSS